MSKQFKPNPYNSSIVQAMLDAISAGIPPETPIGMAVNPDIFKKQHIRGDEIFASHQYPEHNITFSKMSRSAEILNCLTTTAYSLLVGELCRRMTTSNYIRFSYSDLLEYTFIGNKSTARKAVRELLDKGCIAVYIPAAGRAPATYMINPLIATVGKNSPSVTKFWKLTGSKYGYEESEYIVTEYSDPHSAWRIGSDMALCSTTYCTIETTEGKKRLAGYGPIVTKTKRTKQNLEDESLDMLFNDEEGADDGQTDTNS